MDLRSGVLHLYQFTYGEHLVAALADDGLAIVEREIDVTTGRPMGPPWVESSTPLGHDAQMDGCPPAQQAASPLALAV